jgi:hypothetical protein
MPVAQGKSWTFEGLTAAGGQEGRMEVTLQVASIQDTPAGKVVKIDVLTGANKSDEFTWRFQEDGIVQIATQFRDQATGNRRLVTYEPPLRVLKFPAKTSEVAQFAVTGARPGANPGPMNVTFQTQGIQEIDTAMGPMSALATQTVSTYQEKNVRFRTTSTSWWVKNVGMVRYRQEIVAVSNEGQRLEQVTTLRLKSHTK